MLLQNNNTTSILSMHTVCKNQW